MKRLNDMISAIQNGHKHGAGILRQAECLSEKQEVALAIEKHRWHWKPSTVKIIFIAESHVYTNEDELKFPFNKNIPGAPTEFVRLVYCLGYGESELFGSERPKRNSGTWQFWDIFGRLAWKDEGKRRQPRKRERDAEKRLQWKKDTLKQLQDDGIWLLDASLHAMYGRKDQNLNNDLRRKLHESWWQYYGQFVLSEHKGASVYVVGKCVKDHLIEDLKLPIPMTDWIFQPQAKHRCVKPELYEKQGWPTILEELAKKGT